MTAFLRALVVGALIGSAATFYWFVNGRVAGVSGVLSGALRERGDRTDRVLFLVGLVAAGVVATLARGGVVGGGLSGLPLLPLVLAGALVGFGTRLGGGCTSGHGVCGLARLRKRSLVATLTFIAFGAATVFVVARVVPTWGVR
jgi:uncharacterized membrane protein YedE/YeeE